MMALFKRYSLVLLEGERYFRLAFYLVIPLGIFIYLMPVDVLNPTNVDRFIDGDRGLNFIGWHLFRYDEWRFPLGTSQLANWPDYYTVCFTGSNPLMSILLKLLHPILPHRFQFLGFWFLMVCYLNLWSASILLGTLGLTKKGRLLPALLLTVFPPFLARTGQVMLASHFFVILAAAQYFRTQDVEWIVFRNFGLLMVLGGLVHPYFLPMIFIFFLGSCIAFVMRNPRMRIIARQITGIVIILFVVLSVLFVSGAFSMTAIDKGFGVHSMNLNAVFNTMGHSRFFGSLSTGALQARSGFAYWGVGWFIICVITVVFAIKKHGNPLFSGRSHKWIFVGVLTLLTGYAVSNRIYLGSILFFEYKLYGLEPLAQTFRNSTRFFWPVGYAVFALTLLKLSHNLKPWRFQLVVAGATFAQLIEFKPYALRERHNIDPELPRIFESIVEKPDVIELANIRDFEVLLVAAKAGIPIGKIRLGRNSKPRQLFGWPEKGETIVNPSRFIFIDEEDYFKIYKYLYSNSDAELFRVGRRYLLAHKGAVASRIPRFNHRKVIHFENYLDRIGRSATIYFSARQDAFLRLFHYKQFINAMQQRGSRIGSLEQPYSYLAIMDNGKIIYEHSSRDEGIQKRMNLSGNRISMYSAGREDRHKSSIKINGREYSKNRRGINIVVQLPGGTIHSFVAETHKINKHGPVTRYRRRRL